MIEFNSCEVLPIFFFICNVTMTKVERKNAPKEIAHIIHKHILRISNSLILSPRFVS